MLRGDVSLRDAANYIQKHFSGRHDQRLHGNRYTTGGILIGGKSLRHFLENGELNERDIHRLYTPPPKRNPLVANDPGSYYNPADPTPYRRFDAPGAPGRPTGAQPLKPGERAEYLNPSGRVPRNSPVVRPPQGWEAYNRERYAGRGGSQGPGTIPGAGRPGIGPGRPGPPVTPPARPVAPPRPAGGRIGPPAPPPGGPRRLPPGGPPAPARRVAQVTEPARLRTPGRAGTPGAGTTMTPGSQGPGARPGWRRIGSQPPNTATGGPETGSPRPVPRPGSTRRPLPGQVSGTDAMRDFDGFPKGPNLIPNMQIIKVDQPGIASKYYKATYEGKDYFLKKPVYRTAEGEEVGSRAAHLITLRDHVPLAMKVTNTDGTVMSAMTMIDGGRSAVNVRGWQDTVKALPLEIRAKALMYDYVTSQGDRHEGNFMFDRNNKLWITDNEGAFTGHFSSSYWKGGQNTPWIKVSPDLSSGQAGVPRNVIQGIVDRRGEYETLAARVGKSDVTKKKFDVLEKALRETSSNEIFLSILERFHDEQARF